jgi:hypothetical protein
LRGGIWRAFIRNGLRKDYLMDLLEIIHEIEARIIEISISIEPDESDFGKSSHI